MERIIKSILDTDQYKLTMGQGYFNQYSRIMGEWGLVDRGHLKFPKGFGHALEDQVGLMADLKLIEEEEIYLRGDAFYYLKPSYIDWFSHYRYDPHEVHIDQCGNEIEVTTFGRQYRVTYWEIPILSTTGELYYKMTGTQPAPDWRERTVYKAKIWKEHKIHFSDFGTRRRFSQALHEEALKILRDTAGQTKDGGFMNGTSNLDLSRRLGLASNGTYAHEWPMTHAAIYGITMANEKAMEAWAKEFDAYLGTALSDTYRLKNFLISFNAFYAKLFDSTRHDSGDPFLYTDDILVHYKKIRVDARSKTIVYSNDLGLWEPVHIQDYCKSNILAAFGIGQFITNDTDAEKLRLIMKLRRIVLENGVSKNVVKIPDDPGKIFGDPETVRRAIEEIETTY